MKPTRQDLINSSNKVLLDVIKKNLKVLFCGINPSLYSSFTGYHFARPGNRFWKTLYYSGFTKNILTPDKQEILLKSGIGITNLVSRASAKADEIKRTEFIEGKEFLQNKILLYKPSYLTILGIGAYKIAFNTNNSKIGLQQETIGTTKIWVLPNPSGLNAGYPIEKLVEVFKEFREYLEVS